MINVKHMTLAIAIIILDTNMWIYDTRHYYVNFIFPLNTQTQYYQRHPNVLD